MPRVQQSAATSIVKFFQTSSLETAQTVLDLAKDAVRERLKKSADAKARAKTGKPQPSASPSALAADRHTLAAAAPVKKAKKAKPAKAAKVAKAAKAKARKAQTGSLPLGRVGGPAVRADDEDAAVAAAEAESLTH